MTRIIDSLDEVSGPYDALFVDLWGCLHDGYRAFPEAVSALARYRAGGGRVVLLTNSPRPRPAVVRQLGKIGVPRAVWDEIASSGDAAQAAMLAGAVGRRVFHLGPAVDTAFFTDMAEDIAASGPPVERVALTEAEGIVCTGLLDDETETPEDYRATLLYAKNAGMKLLCANPDIVVDRGTQRIYCAGALAALPPDRLTAARLRLAPALRLVRSDWPVAAIWHANTTPGAPPPGTGAQDALVTRPGYDPEVAALGPGEGAFVAALMAGAHLGAAHEAGAATPGFDLTPALGRLLAGGAITGIEEESA